jgi:drug/metabolite transporter (DMT)-like permease
MTGRGFRVPPPFCTVLQRAFLRTSSDRKWLAYAALAAAVLGISWSAIFVRWAGVPGPASAFYRVLVAAVVLVPWRLMRGGVRRPPTNALWLPLLGGVFFALDLGLYNTAVLQTSAATATLLGNNAPIFVGLGTWLIFRRRPLASFWIGLALAIAGCLAVVSTDFYAGQTRTGHVRGDLLALTAAIFWAAYLLTTEQVRASMDTLTFNTLAIAGSVITLLVICLAAGVPLWGYQPRAWMSLLALGLISQLSSYYFLVFALGHLPATVVSVGLLAQIPLTALLAMPLLEEAISAPQMLGGVLVLAGIYVVTRGAGQPEAPQP